MILTYHAIEPGPRPLCIPPELFERHLDLIVESGREVVTISEYAARLRAGTLTGRELALTFDDGMASVPRAAAPLLAARGLTATIFCVAGRIGQMNDWPSARSGGPALELAEAEAIRALAAAEWEIGSHGLEHAPFARLDPEGQRRELEGSRTALEQLFDVEVRSFAYPYGSEPESLEPLTAAGYQAGCATTLAVVGPRDDPLRLPRVDAHYVARPGALRRVLAGRGLAYLLGRRTAARARRVVVPDYDRA